MVPPLTRVDVTGQCWARTTPSRPARYCARRPLLYSRRPHATIPDAPPPLRAPRPGRRLLRGVPRAAPGARRSGPGPAGPDGDPERAHEPPDPARPRPAHDRAVRALGRARGAGGPRSLDHAEPAGAAGAGAAL